MHGRGDAPVHKKQDDRRDDEAVFEHKLPRRSINSGISWSRAARPPSRGQPGVLRSESQISKAQRLTGSTIGTGGFGANNTSQSIFGSGNKSAFGTTNTSSTTPLFGNTTPATTTFGANSGGFGTNTGTAFGANNNASNTGSNFNFSGQTNKPAFGSNTSSSLFGQGGSGTTQGFGSGSGSGSSNAFGSGAGTALNQAVSTSEGTGVAPFQPTNEKEANGGNISYQSISFQQPYQKYSFEASDAPLTDPNLPLTFTGTSIGRLRCWEKIRERQWTDWGFWCKRIQQRLWLERWRRLWCY